MKSKLRFFFNNIFPNFRFSIFDPTSFYVRLFVKSISENTEEGKILDAGAGSCQFKKHFPHLNYESCDFEQVFNKKYKGRHDFVCDLKNIPKRDETYDYVLCTEVLEHVESPQEVVKELYRVLKPGGRLFFSVPQSWGIHGGPHHYFNFTKHGLESILRNAGFKKLTTIPKGGMFIEIGAKIKELPSVIFGKTIFSFLAAAILYPITQFIIPGIAFALDILDKKKDFTIGYCGVAKK